MEYVFLIIFGILLILAFRVFYYEWKFYTYAKDYYMKERGEDVSFGIFNYFNFLKIVRDLWSKHNYINDRQFIALKNKVRKAIGTFAIVFFVSVFCVFAYSFFCQK